jgi:hypothetical protein
MAMELYILSDRRLASAEWQRAIDAEGFSLRLSNGSDLDSVDGFLPAHLDGESTGFECSHWDADELLAGLQTELTGAASTHAWKFALALRWVGSRLDEGVAAYMAAAAYARAAGGVIFDCEEGRFIGPNEAKPTVRELQQLGPQVDEIVRRSLEQLKGPQS